MINRIIHKLFINMLALLFSAGLACAQTPVITPKNGPIILKLDSNGNLAVSLKDVATVTPDNTNPNPYVSVSPTYFNCVSRGEQNVVVTATDWPPPVTFNNPVGIVADAAGNFYITDPANHKIRKIAKNGDVTDFAGSENIGDKDGTDTSARFDEPEGIAIDAAGNLYVTDASELVVRKITPARVVTTFAGTPYISAYDNIDGTGASFDGPYGIAVDGQNNIYVADATGNRIRKVTQAGYITTFAGSKTSGDADGTGTAASFNIPSGIAIDGAGNIYVADSYNNKIRKITPAGVVTTVAGTGKTGYINGPAASATFSTPDNVALDANGNIYVADTKNEQIREINTASVVTTFAGVVPPIVGTTFPGDKDGPGPVASFNTPQGLAFDAAGNLYVADELNNKIRKITPADTVSTFAGSGDAGYQNGNINNPQNPPTARDTIPIEVETTLKITTKYPDVTLTPCQTTMPDFIAENPPKTTDNCNDNIPAHQVPAAGGRLTANSTVPVEIIVEDATGKFDTAAFKVYTPAYVMPPIVSIQPSTLNPVCKGTVISFAATTANATHPAYHWQVNGVTDSATTDSTFSGVFNDGDIITCSIVNGDACSTPAISAADTVRISPSPTISFKDNLVIKSGTQVQLAPVTGGSIKSYLWTPAYGLSNDTIPFPMASPAKTTTYKLSIISDAGCDTTGSVTVTVVDNVIIPNTFTPNGDGINDFWDLKGISLYPACTVSVYNRYGSLIFYSKGYPKPWDGRYHNQALPTGTYYYVIDLKNSTPLLAGAVTIIK